VNIEAVLEAYQAVSDEEARDVHRLREQIKHADPWARTSELHATGSAIVLHPASGRILLRWHERQQAWLQVGGHADPGETSPFAIALREASEETGLSDLVPWPDQDTPRLIQVVIVPVPAGKGEPPHAHADLRYVLATEQPDAAVPESESAQLRWLTLEEALAEVTEANVRECLQRIAALYRELRNV
jgi:8-oxo-dGTP pyrophosphatase MutT (NUDIX family)